MKRPNYITPKSKRIVLSDDDIQKGLDKVNAENKKTRKSFRFDNKALSLKTGRH